MTGTRFDVFTQSLAGPRRTLLSGAVALAMSQLSGLTTAAGKKRRRKRRKPKLKFNDFGCVNVGGRCRGNDAHCCSGRCDGKKPRMGKKDKSVCVGHDDAGICAIDTDSCAHNENILCDPDEFCVCSLTTGNAGFCGDYSEDVRSLCRDCSRDVDCEAEFGSGAACVVLGAVCAPFCPATGRTACVPPCMFAP